MTLYGDPPECRDDGHVSVGLDDYQAGGLLFDPEGHHGSLADLAPLADPGNPADLATRGLDHDPGPGPDPGDQTGALAWACTWALVHWSNDCGGSVGQLQAREVVAHALAFAAQDREQASGQV